MLTSKIQRVGIFVLWHFIGPLTWLHAQELDDVTDSFCIERFKEEKRLFLHSLLTF